MAADLLNKIAAVSELPPHEIKILFDMAMELLNDSKKAADFLIACYL